MFHVAAKETLLIPLLAVIGTTILSPAKTYCQEYGEETQVSGRLLLLLCMSVNAVDQQFKDFGKKIIEQNQMRIDKFETIEGHSVS
jgi:hypothetical protein